MPPGTQDGPRVTSDQCQCGDSYYRFSEGAYFSEILFRPVAIWLPFPFLGHQVCRFLNFNDYVIKDHNILKRSIGRNFCVRANSVLPCVSASYTSIKLAVFDCLLYLYGLGGVYCVSVVIVMVVGVA